MRFAKEEWEQERDGWRSVVQLNVVRSITTIVRVVQAEINGDAPADDSDDQESVITVESNQSETLKFTEKHQLLMIRLAPLVSVEAELKRRLGAGAEPPQLTSMVATPFDTPQENPGRRRPAEFSVRSWKDVIEQEQRSTLLSDGSTACDTDSTTTVMAGCKDDMKALWQDKAVQQALKRRKLVLPDSAGLSVPDLFHLPLA